MTKVLRNRATPESREFWRSAEAANEVERWPPWKRAGINVSDTRMTSVSELAARADEEPKL